MSQTDVLVELVRHATAGNQPAIRQAVERLIAEEEQKGHRILAERLQKALQATHTPPRTPPSPFSGQGGAAPQKALYYETRPARRLDSLVLAPHITVQIRELVEEQQRVELLHAHNLCARHRVLLAGPPGNGKTSLAEALAGGLAYPLITIRYESLMGSYLGETPGRLKSVLDYASTRRCVLFLDEFETLGKERGDSREVGGIKRIVSTLLLQLDAMPDYVVIVAASNHPEMLDRAVWRRFQLRLELPLPTEAQLAHFIRVISDRCQVDFGNPAEVIAAQLAGLNFAETEEFCPDIVRRIVLAGTAADPQAITRVKLEQWQQRLQPLTAETAVVPVRKQRRRRGATQEALPI